MNLPGFYERWKGKSIYIPLVYQDSKTLISNVEHFLRWRLSNGRHYLDQRDLVVDLVSSLQLHPQDAVHILDKLGVQAPLKLENNLT